MVNFDRKGLTLDEMETLLHELGHYLGLDEQQVAAQLGEALGRALLAAPLERGSDAAQVADVGADTVDHGVLAAAPAARWMQRR